MHAAADVKPFRVDDLDAAKRQRPNRPIIQDSPDQVFRNVEPRGDINRAPAVNEEQENHATLHIGRGTLQKSDNLRREGNKVPADRPAEDGATRVNRRLQPRLLSLLHKANIKIA